jgi:hypothetical protein
MREREKQRMCVVDPFTTTEMRCKEYLYGLQSNRFLCVKIFIEGWQ